MDRCLGPGKMRKQFKADFPFQSAIFMSSAHAQVFVNAFQNVQSFISERGVVIHNSLSCLRLGRPSFAAVRPSKLRSYRRSPRRFERSKEKRQRVKLNADSGDYLLEGFRDSCNATK